MRTAEQRQGQAARASSKVLGLRVSVAANEGLSVQGYLAHKKTPPPLDHHRALGIGLHLGPGGGGVRMSEVPLQASVYQSVLMKVFLYRDTSLMRNRSPLGSYNKVFYWCMGRAFLTPPTSNTPAGCFPLTRNRKSETQNSKPKARNSKPETSDPRSKTQNPKPEENPKPETLDLKLSTRPPQPHTPSPKTAADAV